jgi:pimeloyl-ACP methyl ester carboxylesterase
MNALWPDESKLIIPVSDGFSVSAQLMGELTNHVVIFCHGLTSSPDRTLSFAMASALQQSGYSVLRFSFYSGRHLSDSTPTTHARDLDAIVNYVRTHGATKITVLGHSLGGLTALLSSGQAFDHAILLDPSHPSVSPFHKAIWNSNLNRYIYQSKGLEYLMGKPMVEEFTNLKPAEYTQAYHVPTYIITAGAGPLVKQNLEYINLLQAHCKIQHAVVPDASHTFDTPQARQTVCRLITSWLTSK